MATYWKLWTSYKIDFAGYSWKRQNKDEANFHEMADEGEVNTDLFLLLWKQAEVISDFPRENFPGLILIFSEQNHETKWPDWMPVTENPVLGYLPVWGGEPRDGKYGEEFMRVDSQNLDSSKNQKKRQLLWRLFVYF